MLLFGFFLIPTVLAAVQHNAQNVPINVCIHNNTVEWLGYTTDITERNSSNQCMKFQVQLRWLNGLLVREFNITGFNKNWYRLQNSMVRSLDLNGNNIFEITNEMFDDLPANITKVFLRMNVIECLTKGIINNEHLTLLDFTQNHIREIEGGALSKMGQLTSLNLQANKLTNVKFAATLPPTLQHLFLNDNDIEAIPADSFSTLHELRKLYLGKNIITSLEGRSFQGLGKLVSLDLRGNPIKNVDAHTFKSTPLLNLVVSDKTTKNFKAGDNIPLYNERVLTLKSSVKY